MESFRELIGSGKPVLVDFYAEWCGPCKVMSPVLKDLAHRLDGRAMVIKVDIDKSPSAAHMYNVRSVPTLVLFSKGQAVWRHSGTITANELEGRLMQYMQ